MRGEVCLHPFVIGELACGRLRDRDERLAVWRQMPAAPGAMHEEVLRLIEQHALHGRGIGWVDAHLLASALLHRARILTEDRALRSAARGLGIAA